MENIPLLNISNFDVNIVIIDMAIALVVLAGARHIAGMISNVDSTTDITKKTNQAFAISLAGVVLSIAIMLTGVMTGENSDITLFLEAFLVATYGSIGLVMMSVTRFIFDKVSMPSFSMYEEIKKGNIAAAILDSGNMVATAIVIRSIMVWEETPPFEGAALLAGGYILSQIILSLVTLYRLRSYNAHHKTSLQDAIVAGNVATAWRFTGFRIGVALAITATSGLITFSLDGLAWAATLWVTLSLVIIVILSILAAITDRLLLPGVDLRAAVDKKGNVGIATIQFVVVVSIGLLFAVLAS